MLNELTSNIFSWLEQFFLNFYLFFYNNREILFWITAFLVVSVIFTWLLKKFTSAKTYFIASMYKTEEANPLFDRFAHHEKTINFLTTLGLILGFGLIAVDFLYGKKMNKIKRFFLWIASILLLYFFFEFVLQLIIGVPLNSTFVGEEYTKFFGLNLISFTFALTGFAGFILFALAVNAIDIVTKTLIGVKACPGVAPVVPGVEIPNVPLVIPLHAWISLLIILVIHEAFHGITARKEKLKVKGSGLLLLGFLPFGAFVEPDEKEIMNAEPLKQLRVYAAGPIANLVSILVFRIIVTLLLIGLIFPFVTPQVELIKRAHVKGLEITEVKEEISLCGETFEAPAFGVLKEGMLVKELNGVEIQITEDLDKAYKGKKLDEEFVFVVEEEGEEKEFSLKRNKQGKFGASFEEIKEKDYSLLNEIFLFFYYFFFDFFTWLVILSLLLALVNFLPVGLFDGGRIARVIIPSYLGFWKEDEKLKEDLIMKALFFFVILLFVFNALPLFF